ncbi:MAG: RNA polymerase sigma factor [Candidatus Gracilibacteria bacterium]
MQDKQQDIDMFSKHYEENKESVLNYIFYRVGFDRAVAEDLTSEIFIKAFNAFHTFDRERSFKTWIFAIAHNHLINFYYSKKNVLSLDDALKVTKDYDENNALERKMTVEKIFELLEGLPESQKSLVIMRYVNDLSYSEIANILGKEEGAIRTALSRITTSLRNKFEIKFKEPNAGKYERQ